MCSKDRGDAMLGFTAVRATISGNDLQTTIVGPLTGPMFEQAGGSADCAWHLSLRCSVDIIPVVEVAEETFSQVHRNTAHIAGFRQSNMR